MENKEHILSEIKRLDGQIAKVEGQMPSKPALPKTLM
jgi:hypothetical protein